MTDAHTLANFLVHRMSMVFLLLFLLCFLRLRYKRSTSLLICLGCMVLCAIPDYFTLTAERTSTIQALMNTTIQVWIVQGTGLLLSRSRLLPTLFTGITSSAFVLVGDLVATSLMLIGAPLWMTLAAQGALHAVFLWASAHFLRTQYLSLLDSDSSVWRWLWLVPSLVYLACYAICIWPSPLTATPTNLAGALIVMVIMFSAYTLMITLLYQQQKNAEVQRRNQHLELCASEAEREAETLQMGTQQLRIMRHDMRHYVQMLQAYLDAGDYDSLAAALREIDDHVAETAPRRWCDNLAINGLMEHYTTVAERDHVQLDCRMNLPRPLPCNEFEFAAAFSNLMSNALLAASALPQEAERRVCLRIDTLQHQMLLETVNPFVGTIRFDHETGLPLSSRGQGHGFGMESIAAFAEKYHATLDCQAQGQRFVLRLLLPIVDAAPQAEAAR